MPIDYSRAPVGIYQDLIIAQNLSSSERAGKGVDMVYFSGLARQLLSRESSTKVKRLKWFGLLNDPNSYMYEGCGDERAFVCLEDKSGNITANLLMMDSISFFKDWILSWIFWPHKDIETVLLPPAPESVKVWLNETHYTDANNIPVRGVITGRVTYIGPSYSNYLIHPEVSKQWSNAIAGHYANESDLRRAQAQNERLAALAVAEPDFTIGNVQSFEGQPADVNNPHLFIGSGVFMGFIPPNSLAGDIICQFWNSDASAVLRRRANGGFDMIGRAAVITDGEDLDWHRPTDKSFFERDSDNAVDLNLDIVQLTRLSFDTVTFRSFSHVDEDDFPTLNSV